MLFALLCVFSKASPSVEAYASSIKPILPSTILKMTHNEKLAFANCINIMQRNNPSLRYYCFPTSIDLNELAREIIKRTPKEVEISKSIQNQIKLASQCPEVVKYIKSHQLRLAKRSFEVSQLLQNAIFTNNEIIYFGQTIIIAKLYNSSISLKSAWIGFILLIVGGALIANQESITKPIYQILNSLHTDQPVNKRNTDDLLASQTHYTDIKDIKKDYKAIGVLYFDKFIHMNLYDYLFVNLEPACVINALYYAAIYMEYHLKHMTTADYFEIREAPSHAIVAKRINQWI
eukprot:NODE_131_length_16689_cov_0.437914.p1 type:complete len:290 gc:universal NODE_131_length_16689_cov_0.437914:1686-817(-)